mgnify:CR=1 FL=1
MGGGCRCTIGNDGNDGVDDECTGSRSRVRPLSPLSPLNPLSLLKERCRTVVSLVVASSSGNINALVAAVVCQVCLLSSTRICWRNVDVLFLVWLIRRRGSKGFNWCKGRTFVLDFWSDLAITFDIVI